MGGNDSMKIPTNPNDLRVGNIYSRIKPDGNIEYLQFDGQNFLKIEQ